MIVLPRSGLRTKQSVTLVPTLSDIAESGHYRMPPTQPHADEVEALAAYIGSLRKDEETRAQHERF